MKDNQHNYQIILVLNTKSEDKDKDKVLAKVESWLDVNKAKVTKKEHTGVKELVYEIAKSRKGDFWMLDVGAGAPLKLNEINLFLNREANVMRYLILKVSAFAKATVDK
jgi:ribosomal protein S6